MKTPLALTLLAATAVLARAGGSSAPEVPANSSSAEVGRLVEDQHGVTSSGEAKSNEAVGGGDERTASGLASFAEKSVSKVAVFAKQRIALTPKEMNMLAKPRISKKALMILKRPDPRMLVDAFSRLDEMSHDKLTTLIATLTKVYRDDVLVVVLAEAKNSNDLESKRFATILSKYQVQGWLDDRKSPDKVLDSLKLREDHVDAKLEVFDEFFTAYYGASPGGIDLLDFLASQFGGEGKVALMLSNGVTSHTRSDAKVLVLETQLLSKWIGKGVEPKEFTRRLEMTNGIGDLTGPKLRFFFKYNDMLSAKKKRLALSLDTIFKTFFSVNDLTWTLMTASNKRSLLKEDAKKVIIQQLAKNWVGGHKAPVDFMKDIGLGEWEIDDTFFVRVGLLEEFMKAYVNEKGVNADIIEVMVSGYDDWGTFVSAVGSAKRIYNSRSINDRFEARADLTNPFVLEERILKKWMDMSWSPDYAADKVKLFGHVEYLTSSMLGTIMRYSDFCSAEYSMHEFWIAKTFLDKFGDEAVMDELVVAVMTDAMTAVPIEGVQKLKAQLFRWWISSGETADHVVKSLFIKKEPHDDFWARVELLDEFLSAYNAEKKEKVDSITALISGLGGEDKLDLMFWKAAADPTEENIAFKLQTNLLEKWKGLGVKPEEVVYRLKKTENVQELMGPKLHPIMRYIEMLDVEHPMRSFSLIEMLMENGEKEEVVVETLVNKLAIARLNKPMNEDLGKLKLQLVKWWVGTGKKPDHVFKSLELYGSNALSCFDTKVEVLEDFIKAYNEHWSSNSDLLTVMISGFGGDDKLALAVHHKIFFDSKGRAADLEKQLFMRWHALYSKKPEQVVELALKMTVKELTGPKLRIFKEYINTLDATDLGHATSPPKMFSKLFGAEAVAVEVQKARAKNEGWTDEVVEELLVMQ